MGLVRRWFKGNTQLAEREIDNAYWKLPKEGVFEALKIAVSLVREHRGMRGDFFCSIARGGEHLLDRSTVSARRPTGASEWFTSRKY